MTRSKDRSFAAYHGCSASGLEQLGFGSAVNSEDSGA